MGFGKSANLANFAKNLQIISKASKSSNFAKNLETISKASKSSNFAKNLETTSKASPNVAKNLETISKAPKLSPTAKANLQTIAKASPNVAKNLQILAKASPTAKAKLQTIAKLSPTAKTNLQTIAKASPNVAKNLETISKAPKVSPNVAKNLEMISKAPPIAKANLQTIAKLSPTAKANLQTIAKASPSAKTKLSFAIAQERAQRTAREVANTEAGRALAAAKKRVQDLEKYRQSVTQQIAEKKRQAGRTTPVVRRNPISGVWHATGRNPSNRYRNEVQELNKVEDALFKAQREQIKAQTALTRESARIKLEQGRKESSLLLSERTQLEKDRREAAVAPRRTAEENRLLGLREKLENDRSPLARAGLTQKTPVNINKVVQVGGGVPAPGLILSEKERQAVTKGRDKLAEKINEINPAFTKLLDINAAIKQPIPVARPPVPPLPASVPVADDNSPPPTSARRAPDNVFAAIDRQDEIYEIDIEREAELKRQEEERQRLLDEQRKALEEQRRREEELRDRLQPAPAPAPGGGSRNLSVLGGIGGQGSRPPRAQLTGFGVPSRNRRRTSRQSLRIGSTGTSPGTGLNISV